MGSLENTKGTCSIEPDCCSIEPVTGPRISFSDEFLDEKILISVSPLKKEKERGKEKFKNAEFEFLSSNLASETTMISADELFFEGKLLPFCKIHQTVDVQTGNGLKPGKNDIKEEPKMSFFLDDDPSPRPPNCTVLFKELLRLRKKRVSTLSPSSSTSSSSSSGSITDVHLTDEGKNGKYMKKINNGLERTRSGSLRIRPMVNVSVCTQAKNNASLPPRFFLKKGRTAEK